MVIDWPKWDASLGTMTDGAAAQRIGCTAHTVYKHRRKVGIPRYDSAIDWSQWDHLLGRMSDYHMAKKIGTSKDQVAHRREVKGVPRYGVTLKRRNHAAQKRRKEVTDAQIAKRTAELTTRRDVPGCYVSSAAMWDA